ncbi:MutH/Sau3AI family endonuclease [Alloscardovia omnicolens]|uniref:MutH/Sau3AI family endonuclease n=1 Tax=Alloscardovia omnicolens TaxID=419015 RepID=UPI00254FEE28|nr:MutH/Sau3AI family endonuclease [Alloscardovia omnicolens]MDK8649943.1 MutH/Sau3AI family endonuclease [Alloscardovia omnicolens]
MTKEGNHSFTRSELERLLNATLNKTLGEVDKNNVFKKTEGTRKITGIAGAVIEQSVLGYPADSKQAPDLNVDGLPVELKVTGIRRKKTKKNTATAEHTISKKTRNFDDFEAKEPMSITAVQPEKISEQTFENSPFWHKVKNMLLVYYWYKSDSTVSASEYRNFEILKYQFHEFSGVELETLKKDWQLIHDFLTEINQNSLNPKADYPRLSSELRDKLSMLDTAPKFPNRPRFRLKRSVVDIMFKKAMGEKYEALAHSVFDVDTLDERSDELTKQYAGKTTLELVNELGIELQKNGHLPKNVHEQIVVAMLTDNKVKTKINKLEVFARTGVIGKTITLRSNGIPKEDTKFFHLDFDEIARRNVEDEDGLISDCTFEDSYIYNYLHEQSFFFGVFQLTDATKKTEDGSSIFKGFKRITISEEDIYNEAQALWEDIRSKIHNHTLELDEKNGAPNFFKGKDHPMFVRGSAPNSSYIHKTEVVNGRKMIPQYFWMSKKYIQELLEAD